MKNKLLIILIAFLALIFACEDDESENQNDIIPDELIGTWTLESSEVWFSQTREYCLLTISKVDSKNGLFEDSFIGDYLEENAFVVLEATKGSFTVNKNKIFPVPTHYGSQIGNDEVSTLDTTMWWNSEDPEFYNFEYDDEIVFEVNGNTLEITTRDYETSIYTKVNL